MTVARFPSLAHWGAFTALVENGRVIGCEPFARDPAPSNMIAAIPEMVHSPLRIARPAIREGWREGKERTGTERFHEVSWDEALDAVAAELARVREKFGHTAILGGSYGWSSAGRVHHARSLVRRFLFLGGGCVDQVGNYSFGAAQYILPRVIGTFQPAVGQITDWSSIVKHTRLILAFGGLATKNGQVTSGGAGAHSMETWLRRAKDAGIEFVSVSPLKSDAPDFLGAQWIADPAEYRYRTDAGDGAHAAQREALRRAIRRALLHRLRSIPPLSSWVSTTTSPKDAQWAEAITGVAADTVRELARRAAATRSMITCAWSLQRAHHGEQPYWAAIVLAAMLGGIGLPGGGFAFGHGSSNGIGVPRVDVAGPEVPLPLNPARSMIPVARHRRRAAPSRRELRIQRPPLQLSRYSAGLLGGRQSVPPPPGSQPAAARLAEAGDGHRPRELVDADRAPRRYRAAGDHHARAQRRRRLVARSLHSRHAPRDRSGRRRQERLRHFPRPCATPRLRDRFHRATATRWAGANGSTTRCARAPTAKGVALPGFQQFWAEGFVELPPPERDYVLFEDFRRDPERHPLKTPSGRIEIVSDAVAGFDYADCPPHPAWLPPAEWLGSASAQRWPMHLVTHQPASRLHSQMDPGPVSRGQKVKGREPVRINPQDATAARHPRRRRRARVQRARRLSRWRDH